MNNIKFGNLLVTISRVSVLDRAGTIGRLLTGVAERLGDKNPTIRKLFSLIYNFIMVRVSLTIKSFTYAE